MTKGPIRPIHLSPFPSNEFDRYFSHHSWGHLESHTGGKSTFGLIVCSLPSTLFLPLASRTLQILRNKFRCYGHGKWQLTTAQSSTKAKCWPRHLRLPPEKGTKEPDGGSKSLTPLASSLGSHCCGLKRSRGLHFGADIDVSGTDGGYHAIQGPTLCCSDQVLSIFRQLDTLDHAQTCISKPEPCEIIRSIQSQGSSRAPITRAGLYVKHDDLQR